LLATSDGNLVALPRDGLVIAGPASAVARWFSGGDAALEARLDDMPEGDVRAALRAADLPSSLRDRFGPARRADVIAASVTHTGATVDVMLTAAFPSAAEASSALEQAAQIPRIGFEVRDAARHETTIELHLRTAPATVQAAVELLTVGLGNGTGAPP
jgi:hypothetical protein